MSLNYNQPAVSRPLRSSPLDSFAFALALLVALPVLAVGINLFSGGTGGTWSHLMATVLPHYVANSIWLCCGVGLGVASMGTGAAWLVALNDFPGRRIAEWALLLPMAMPAYVLAYTYTDFLQFVGPVQTTLRESFGWTRDDYWFPEVRSLGGAVVLFSCVLYPYVYLLARTAFLERAGGMIEAARALGLNPWQGFWRVSIPLARPAIAAGMALALMETLADYGTVAYFAVQTFTTGIYRAWFSLGDRVAAAQLSASLLGFVAALILLERVSRGHARYHDSSGRRRATRQVLRGWHALLAQIGCSIPVVVGFLLPAILLLRLAFGDSSEEAGNLSARFMTLARNSCLLAALAAAIAAAMALLLGFAAREGRFLSVLAGRVVGLGYAVPGSVIAVGVLIPVTRLDHWLADIWQQLGGANPGLILTGGLAALVYAYLARFLAIALQTVEAGMARITPSMEAAARSLGSGPGETLRRVHLPLLRGSLLTAALLVFVDVMKELPATLVMRPFNFDTLATQTFTLAADERLAEASSAALAIVVVGLLPIIILARQISAGRSQVSSC
ncbi:MAG: iron ABC transporter permease [Sulfuritalea sp.]|jgi:iron(III) transport system permease protein|nr:iron ABC transporter permease [Sulfuritalea sp.]MBK9351455.1 iron ABC transporter permease [Sulfuritalea sp.]MBP9229827.1 iron ABC transporter permease [Azonexus sp.]